VACLHRHRTSASGRWVCTRNFGRMVLCAYSEDEEPQLRRKLKVHMTESVAVLSIISYFWRASRIILQEQFEHARPLRNKPAMCFRLIHGTRLPSFQPITLPLQRSTPLNGHRIPDVPKNQVESVSIKDSESKGGSKAASHTNSVVGPDCIARWRQVHRQRRRTRRPGSRFLLDPGAGRCVHNAIACSSRRCE
jgi:hypothetical protein